MAMNKMDSGHATGKQARRGRTSLARTRMLALTLLALTVAVRAGTQLSNDAYQLALTADGDVTVTSGGALPRKFSPRFAVMASSRDPKLELRWGDWSDGKQAPLYNVLTWAGSEHVKPSGSAPKKHIEDGFDPKSDQVAGKDRVQNLFDAAPAMIVRADKAEAKDGRIVWGFPANADFTLDATLELPAGNGEPVLMFQFKPKVAKWFSVGYVGAPEADPSAMDGMWQPLIWQEKRFPQKPYLTESGRCTLPATLVAMDGVVWGVVADPVELPFMPMPTVANSRFGVAVRNAAGQAQPMVFAPILGGLGSKRAAGEALTFKLRLVVQRGKIADVYANLARGLYGFTDYRHNALGSLNRTMERVIDYAMSDWARFNEDLRGCAYDTDVPGSVKNVSSLHPLGVALVTDDESIFVRRARPIVEAMMSREKFLFTIDPNVKGQGASARLTGPCAPVSELAALYGVSGQRSPLFLRAAEKLYGKTRTLNLDAAVRGDIWQNALALWRATGDAAWLTTAKAGADAYIRARIETPQKDFKDPAARGVFFWTSFAPNWMELYEVFEATGEPRYLEAAREGARRFAQYIWMCPEIPAGDVLVNEGGRSPLYRKSDKLPPILLPEERVPAWRVSEIGLTCESSGTSKGHRGILLATHGPWMLRLAEYTDDVFLHDIGRSAIIGRYTSFPGYHMNTARTTVYEKPDFAERPMAQLNSTTSLHYNHIWPHAAMLLDYLVADAESRSDGAIKFPSQFAEGYAYLQQQIYGDRPGRFLGDTNVWLWMPKGLLTFDNEEINYVAGRRGDTLYFALMNQSADPITATCRVDANLARVAAGAAASSRLWQENKLVKTEPVNPGSFTVQIAPRGITALAISGMDIKPKFQEKFSVRDAAWQQDATELDFAGTHAMLLNFGRNLKSAYVYLQANGTELKRATLHYSTGGDWKQMSDAAFPFEFTVPLAAEAKAFRFKVAVDKTDGGKSESQEGVLRQ